MKGEDRDTISADFSKVREIVTKLILCRGRRTYKIKDKQKKYNTLQLELES